MNTSVSNAKGHCLCGEVEISVAELNPEFGACHCHMCQRWGGGPLLAADCGDQVTFSGKENITVYASSDWAERGFCKNCGSHLFYHLVSSGQYIMPLGLFEITEDFKFDHQIFVDEKPDCYQFANETGMLTGEQVFASFAEDQHDDH